MKYEDLINVDLIEGATEKLRSGVAQIEGDKIVFRYHPQKGDVPWLFKKVSMERDCIKWHEIYFNLYGLLPRGCMNCWKIVCRPKSLDELFELSKLQDRQVAKGGIACKCGVDVRATETYKGIYLGFWYCPLGDLNGAKELYVKVKRDVRGALALDTPVILKRGCTEMENRFGPSHLWEYTEARRNLETLLDSAIVAEYDVEPQSLLTQTRTTSFWISYAHRMVGSTDKTVRKYIRNFPMSMGSIPTSTYHDKVPKIKEEIVEDERTEGKKVNIQRV